MASYKQGDILLLPFPYTDLSDSKKRPAVIISNHAASKRNFIVAKITSVIRNDDFSFSISPSDIEGTISRESEVRTNELFTIHKSIIVRRIATFQNDALLRLLKKVSEHFLQDN